MPRTREHHPTRPEEDASDAEISALLNAATDFVALGVEQAPGLLVNTLYSTEDGNLILVVSSDDGTVCSITITGSEHRLVGWSSVCQICLVPKFQINLTSDYLPNHTGWQVGLYDEAHQRPSAEGIPQALAQRITSLLEKHIPPHIRRSTNSIRTDPNAYR